MNKKQRGALLLELALALAVLGILLPPLGKLISSQRELARAERSIHLERHVHQALLAYITTNGNLPCPSNLANGTEARIGEVCQMYSGWLPTASLGITPVNPPWRLTVAGLETLGEPINFSLTRPQGPNQIPIQILTDAILAPPSASTGIDTTALPAIHICILDSNEELPSSADHGCGEHPTHYPAAVAVATPASSQQDTANEPRVNQFFVNPSQSTGNPIWISYNQFIWTWVQAGWHNQP